MKTWCFVANVAIRMPERPLTKHPVHAPRVIGARVDAIHQAAFMNVIPDPVFIARQGIVESSDQRI
jgi:hypothetical protein